MSAVAHAEEKKVTGKMLWDAYPAPEYLDMKPLTEDMNWEACEEAADSCGDGLFKYLIRETVGEEVGEAIRKLTATRDDLEAVAEYLQSQVPGVQP